jgi:hypothetical protein
MEDDNDPIQPWPTSRVGRPARVTGGRYSDHFRRPSGRSSPVNTKPHPMPRTGLRPKKLTAKQLKRIVARERRDLYHLATFPKQPSKIVAYVENNAACYDDEQPVDQHLAHENKSTWKILEKNSDEFAQGLTETCSGDDAEIATEKDASSPIYEKHNYAKPEDVTAKLELARAVIGGTASTEVERRLAGLVGAKKIKPKVRRQAKAILEIVEAQGKEKRGRGRPRKSGKRTTSGQLSRAATARDQGTPEVQARQAALAAALGLSKPMAGADDILLDKGLIDPEQHSALRRFCLDRAAALSWLIMPTEPGSALGSWRADLLRPPSTVEPKGGWTARAPRKLSDEEQHKSWVDYRALMALLTEQQERVIQAVGLENKIPAMALYSPGRDLDIHALVQLMELDSGLDVLSGRRPAFGFLCSKEALSRCNR